MTFLNDSGCFEMQPSLPIPKPRTKPLTTSEELGFWVPAEEIHVFESTMDRRLASIARLCRCHIFLTEGARFSPLTGAYRLALIESDSQHGLDKCRNMILNTFPNFRLAD